MSGMRGKITLKIIEKVEDVFHHGHKEVSVDPKPDEYSGGTQITEEHSGSHLTGFIMNQMKRKVKKILLGGSNDQHGEEENEEEEVEEGDEIEAGEDGEAGGELGAGLAEEGGAAAEALEEGSAVVEALAEGSGGIMEFLSEVFSSIEI